jgi:hypothetical protein
MTNKNRPVNPKNQRFSFKLILTLAFVTLLAWQCVSPPDYLGGDLIPDQDRFRVKMDTSFMISAYTMPYDTLITMMFQDAILGETYDAVFGRTKASVVTQLYTTTQGHKFGTGVTIDSVYLFLKLRSRFGDEPVNFSVYELTDSLHKDTIYNSLSPMGPIYSNTQIGYTTEGPYTGEKNLLRISMDENWVRNKLVEADSATMANPSNFLKHLYGIYITPTNDFASHAKGLYTFDYLSPDSKLVVYYKNAEMDHDTASLFYNYSLDQRCWRFMHFEHNLSVADPDKKMSFNPPINTQDSVFYVKGLGGARGLLVLDDILAWTDLMPVAINKAELRIELEKRDGLIQDSLINNLMFYQLKDNRKTSIIDFLVNENIFGGKYNKSKEYYSFNITYHLQNLLKNPDSDKTIYIEHKDFSRMSNGAVLRSGSHSSRMKLILTYTKL